MATTDKFPASAAFDEINKALNASEADRKDAMKQGNAVFAFTLKNAAGETDSWNIDLKTKGAVSKGLGDKPTGGSPLYFWDFNDHDGFADMTGSCYSHPLPLRIRLWQPRRRQGQRPAAIHVGQAQDQGRRHEGHQARPHPQEGPDQGQALNCYF